MPADTDAMSTGNVKGEGRMTKATERELKRNEAEQKDWDKTWGRWLSDTVIWPGHEGWRQAETAGENWQAHVYGGARGEVARGRRN